MKAKIFALQFPFAINIKVAPRHFGASTSPSSAIKLVEFKDIGWYTLIKNNLER